MQREHVPYALRWSKGIKFLRMAQKFQRWSGVVLSAFSAWHIIILSNSATDPAVLSAHLSTLYKPLTMSIVGILVAFHSFNGLRIILFEVGAIKSVTWWHILLVGVLTLVVGVSGFLVSLGWLR
ncbi:MAG: hypothetical protein QXT77_03960 [Candidatus Methanomethylicaceae archaeon]